MDPTKEELITVDLTDLCRLDPYYGAVPPMSVIDANTMPNVYIPGGTVPYTFNNVNSKERPNKSAVISLAGDDADIEINGESLMSMIRGIQDRLNILTPDPDMEQEWHQLGEIRKLYELKLQECRQKSRMWQQLKDTAPPNE